MQYNIFFVAHELALRFDIFSQKYSKKKILLILGFFEQKVSETPQLLHYG